MLAINVQKKLIENKHLKRRPGTMTQLAAVMDVSLPYLYRLIKNEKNASRFAEALGVDPRSLCSNCGISETQPQTN